jgi:anti-anti-sigma factor
MPIDCAVRAWCDDTFTVITVSGDVDADSCGVVALTVAEAAQAYRTVIIDLTHVRRLSVAGLRCLDCTFHNQEDQQGSVHLVCPDASAALITLQAAQIQDRWPVHQDLVHAVHDVMLPLSG